MLCGDGVAQGIELGRRESAHNNETTLDRNRSALLPAMVAESRKYLRGYDLCRSGVMVSWSAVGDVPLNIILFSAIHRVLHPLGIPAVAAFPQSFFKGILFFVPGVLIRMPCFITYVTSCEHAVANWKKGRSVTDGRDARMSMIVHKMEQNLAGIFENGAKLWVPVNTLTFYAVPVVYRPLTLSFVTVGWMTYLSIVQHEEDHKSKQS